MLIQILILCLENMAELKDLRATPEDPSVQYHWAEHWPPHDTCLEGVTSNPGAGKRARDCPDL